MQGQTLSRSRLLVSQFYQRKRFCRAMFLNTLPRRSQLSNTCVSNGINVVSNVNPPLNFSRCFSGAQLAINNTLSKSKGSASEKRKWFKNILPRSAIYNRKFSSKSEQVENLEEVLTDTVLKLEEIDTNLYRGVNLWKPVGGRSVFGGQIIGQAMVAANKTRPNDVFVHSMHSYFIRPGNPQIPIIYQVDRTLDGRSFCNRFVKAVQKGETIFTLQLSYHKFEESQLEYQGKMPKVPPPLEVASIEDKFKEYLSYDTLTTRQRQYIEKRLAEEIPIEIRPLDPEGHFRISGEEKEPKQMYWVRARGYIGDDMDLHRCVAAYMSDLTMIPTALSGFQGFNTTMAASLDHAMWFHSPFRADEFMLYECQSNRTIGARSLIHGRLWKEDGTLAVSVSQEGVIRGKMRDNWKASRSVHNETEIKSKL